MPGERDSTFPFFSVEQARRFRALTVASFAERGMEVVPYPGHVEAVDGQRFRLHGMAAHCKDALRGERAWRGIIDSHVENVMTSLSAPDPLATISQREAEEHVHLRLCALDTVPERVLHGYGYASQPVPGLLELLALDEPATVRFFTDAALERFDVPRLREAALRNLLTSPVDVVEGVTRDDGTSVHVLAGESFYLASKLLVMRHVLFQQFGEREYPYGVLVSAPFRHQLALHVVEDDTVLPSLITLAGIARQGHAQGAGPLSPHVYWWNGGGLVQVTSTAPDGTPTILVDGPFGDAFKEAIGMEDDED